MAPNGYRKWLPAFLGLLLSLVIAVVPALAQSGPSITSLSVTSGSFGTYVDIVGTNFGTTRGTSTVTFNGIGTAPAGWSATSIPVFVPNGATTGYVVVTVGGVASNGVNFTVLAGNFDSTGA